MSSNQSKNKKETSTLTKKDPSQTKTRPNTNGKIKPGSQSEVPIQTK